MGLAARGTGPGEGRIAVASEPARADTFPKLLMRNARAYAGRPAYRHKDLGIWQVWTWAQVHEEVRAFSVGLRELGLTRDDKVAIVGSNRPRLYWAMCAAQALGAVPVPIYADSVAEEMAYILEHAEVTIAVVEDQEQVDKLLSIADRLPRLSFILYDEPRGLRDYDHQRLRWIADVQKLGHDSLAADAQSLQRWEAAVAAGRGEDLAVMLYTSGTTGRPKGVMLTFDNLVVSAVNGNLFDKLGPDEEVVAYLPLAWLGEILVYGPLKNRLGVSRIRLAYTAGEAIGPEIFRFWRSLGVNLKQLYGQTEASVYITAQPDGEIYADTVGKPNIGVDIKVAENGEVLFKSPGVFAGYYKDPQKTAETKTPDGWVHTGDAGFIDTKTGHLKIIDRAKDVGRLNDGSLLAPKYIENKLKFYPNIREAVVYGDKRDFVCAMLNIDLTAVGNWAERNNIVYGSYQELAGHPRVYDMLAEHVEEVNRSLAEEEAMGGAQIRRFLILHKELDADDGEVTRTQKVRRGFVAERYAPLITALYSGAREADISTEVTFEDGRKGMLSARVKIRDVRTVPVPAMEKVA